MCACGGLGLLLWSDVFVLIESVVKRAWFGTLKHFLTFLNRAKRLGKLM